MRKVKIDTKTIIGVGSGVAVGFLMIKSRNPLALIALGLLGGIIASQIKTKSEKNTEDKENEYDYLDKIKEDIDATLEFDEKLNAEGLGFNPTVGYITPHGEVSEQNPRQFMDLSI